MDGIELIEKLNVTEEVKVVLRKVREVASSSNPLRICLLYVLLELLCQIMQERMRELLLRMLYVRLMQKVLI